MPTKSLISAVRAYRASYRAAYGAAYGFRAFCGAFCGARFAGRLAGVLKFACCVFLVSACKACIECSAIQCVGVVGDGGFGVLPSKDFKIP